MLAFSSLGPSPHSYGRLFRFVLLALDRRKWGRSLSGRPGSRSGLCFEEFQARKFGEFMLHFSRWEGESLLAAS